MKRLLTFLTLLTLFFSIGWATTVDYSMTPDQASTGSTSTQYITTLTEFTYNTVSWKMNQWNPSTLQIKTNQNSAASQFRFYNTSAFPGKITKVVLKFSQLTLSNTETTGFMFVGGTSEVTATSGGTNGIWNSTNKTITWEPSADDNFTYFAFYQNGKVATQTNKLATSDAIVVTYEGGSTPTEPFAITYTTPTNGSFASGNPTEATAGSTVQIATVPAEGFALSALTVTPSATVTLNGNNASFTMPSSAVTVAATFSKLYAITVADNSGTANPTTAYEGQTVTVTPTIPDGKVLDSYTVVPSSVTLTPDGNGGYTFTMPNEAVSVTFAFKDDPAAGALFYESWSQTSGSGGNDGRWSGTIAQGTVVSDVTGWVYANEGGASNCVKLGTTGKLGTATSPSITVVDNKIYTLTFKAAAWDYSSEHTILKLSATGANLYSDASCTTTSTLSSVNMTKGAWTNYTVYVKATDEALSIKWEGETSSNSRFFLDEVKLVEYSAEQFNIYRTITAENPNDEGGSLGDWSCYNEYPNANYAVKAAVGELVTFKAKANQGYTLQQGNLTAVYGNNQTVTLNTTWTPDNEGKISFSFTMPASDVTITANFTFERPVLRLAGRFNGGTQTGDDARWVEDNSGPEFTYTYKDENNTVVDKYTINAYFIGAHNEGDNGYGDYFYFRAGNSDLKSTVASGDNDWITEAKLGQDLSELSYSPDGNNNTHGNFRIMPGVYKITINGARTTVRFDRITPTISFNPLAGEVLSGTNVTATSTLTTLINDIKANDSGAKGSVTVKVGEQESNINADQVTIDEAKTVYGKAWIGHIETPVANATYTIKQIETETLTYTESFSEDFGKFTPDDLTIWTIAQSGDNKYAKATSYNNGAHEANSKLVSPYIDLTHSTKPQVSFSHAGNHFGGQAAMANAVKVLIKKQSDDDWTELSGVTYPAGNNWTFVDSKSLLDDYIGEIIQIAFQYTATASTAGTWEINNFKVAELYSVTCNTAENGSISTDEEEYTEGDVVTVNVTPDPDYKLSTLTYTVSGSSEAVTITATDGVYSFEMPEGNVTITATFTEDVFEPSADDFILVTSQDDIVAGREYIIVSKDHSLAMGTIGNNDYGAPVEGSVFNANFTRVKAAQGVKVLTLGGSEGAWTLKYSDDYYIWLEKDGANIYAKASTYTNTAYSMSLIIQYQEDGTTLVTTLNGQSSSRQIGYNGTSDKFGHWGNTNYTSANTKYQKVYLYYRDANPVTPTTLANLCDKGVVDNYYTINEALTSVGYYHGKSIWFKDNGNKSIHKTSPQTGDKIFPVKIDDENTVDQTELDQSNWIEVECLTAEEAQTYSESVVSNLTGQFVNKANPKLVLTKTITTQTNPDGNYEPNVYIPANFMGRQKGNTNDFYFFVEPKPQEYATILYAMYEGNNVMTMVTGNKNPYEFGGSFTLDLSMNAASSNPFNPSVGDIYSNFEVIIQVPNPSESPNLKNAATGYTVYPLNLSEENQLPTGINTIEIGNGEVKSVKYVNVAGIVSDTPFQGVNIVVTEYTDGSRTTTKMLRK